MMEYKLEDIADVTMGQSPKSEFYNNDGDGMPFLQGNRTFGRRYPTFDTYTTKVTKKAKAGDVIMSVRAPVGDLNITPIDMCLGRGVCGIRMKNGKQDFLFYLMKYNMLKLLNKQAGTVFGSVNRKDINGLMVEVPDEETQDKIASFLGQIDHKIEVNEAINRNLQEQSQAYFNMLFIENVSDTWTEGVLSDVGTVVAGGTPSKAKDEYYTEKGIAWITPKDLSTDKSVFVSHGGTDISDLGYEKSSASKLPEGTVLFSSRAPIGYIAIAANEVTTNQGFKSVVPNDGFGTVYIFFLLKHLLPTIEGMASGSTFKEVSGSVMKNVPALIPDNNTINIFNDFCEPIFSEIRRLENESRRLVSLRDSLLPKLMSGDLDVANLDI